MSRKILVGLAVVGLAVFGWSQVSQATTYTVKQDGSGNFTTIQAALDYEFLRDGDIILVGEGTYNELIQIDKSINLIGAGADKTTIRGNGATMENNQAVVLLYNMKGGVISGFKITNANYGIRTVSSTECTPVIRNNVIVDNLITGMGFDGDDSPTIENNVVVDNSAWGIAWSSGAVPYNVSPIIKNNIVVGHSIGIHFEEGIGSPTIKYNDVWNNTVLNYSGCGAGTGDISSDPLFADGDYHLGVGSPCKDAGDPDSNYNDADGSRNDMGAYGGSTYIVTPTLKISYISVDQPYGMWYVGTTLIFSVVTTGAQGELKYRWDLDGDGYKDDSEDPTPSKPYDTDRSYLIGVEVRDSVSVATEWLYITIGKPPAPQQTTVKPAVDLIPPGKFDSSGNQFDFIESRKNKGLIIITHGIYGSVAGAGKKAKWLRNMATAIENRLGADTPNICLYDWSLMADPTLYEEGVPHTGPLDDIENIIRKIRPYGKAQGLVLADWINEQVNLGKINIDKPIQIIGHSAGGFVAGSCANALRDKIEQITLLDTPVPLSNCKYLDAGGKIYACLTMWGTRPSDWSHWELLSHPQVHTYGWKTGEYPTIMADCPTTTNKHSWAHDWYTKKTITGSQHEGFWYSPWLWPDPHWALREMTMAGALRMAETAYSELNFATTPIENFDTFGDVTVADGVYTITEGTTDAGIFKTINFPANVQSVTFKYRFTTAGDGDFLSVHMDEDTVLYIGLDLEISRDNYVDGEATITDMAGTSGQLTFKLVSRGDANAVLSIKSIELVTTPASSVAGTGGGGGGGGCFIATAAFGTPMADEVKSLCKFRDDVLLKTPLGRDFVKFYYATSPLIANFIRYRPELKEMVREALKPLVEYSKLIK